jgi:hypothetical protein
MLIENASLSFFKSSTSIREFQLPNTVVEVAQTSCEDSADGTEVFLRLLALRLDSIMECCQLCAPPF